MPRLPAFLAFAASAALLAAQGFASPILSASPETPYIVVETSQTQDVAYAQLLVRAFDGKAELEGRWKGAEVSLNRAYAGYTRYERKDLPPGTVLLELAATGFRPRSLVLELQAGRRYELQVPLQPKQGWVSASILPPDAELVIGGFRFDPGLIELREGSYDVRVRRFGYVEKELSLKVVDALVTELRLSLEEAPFAASDLELARPRFNPRNAGIIGRSPISFQVSSYGSARLEIRAKDGGLAYARDFPSFDTWRQSASWDGRLPNGDLAPDGAYRVRVEARAAPSLRAGQEPGAKGPLGPGGNPSFLLEGELQIDSSIVVEPIGAAGGSPGLLFMADPRPLPLGTGVIDASLFAAAAPPLVPVLDLGLAFELENIRVFLDAATGLTGESAESAKLGGGFMIPLLPRRSAVAAGLGLSASWSAGAASPPLGGSEGLDASFFLPLALGGRGFLLGLQPRAGLAWDPGTEPAFAYGTGAALWTSGPRHAAGLSGEWRAWSSGGWRVDLSLEGRLVLGATPLVLHLGTQTGFSSGRDPEVRLSGGIGLLI